MENIKEFVEKVSQEFQEPKEANAFKASYTESSFQLDFGNIVTQDESKVEVDVISSITISPDKVINLIVTLFSAANDYLKEFKKADMGFPDLADFDDDDEDEDEDEDDQI